MVVRPRLSLELPQQTDSDMGEVSAYLLRENCLPVNGGRDDSRSPLVEVFAHPSKVQEETLMASEQSGCERADVGSYLPKLIRHLSCSTRISFLSIILYELQEMNDSAN